MIAWFALLSCDRTAPEPEPEPVFETCDAGDAAWVQRALPLMWGRRAHGAAEVAAWSAMARAHGREAVIEAMAADPEYVAAWRDWVTDALGVARTGDKAHRTCFASPLREVHDGALTARIARTPETWNEPPVEPFNMADVITDALIADDLSAAWRAHLFARMARPVQGANVSELELEYNRRVNFGETFYETYLNRNLDCVLCHNSRYSVTDARDARDDLTWQLPGHHERALLGNDITFDKDTAYGIFRHARVVRDFGGRRPWGMDPECGRFYSPSNAGFDLDPLGSDEVFFVHRYGPEGSVWQVERLLGAGVAALAAGGLAVADDGSVDGRESFAYLLGARIVDEVVESALGGKLTIAHGFPRNLEQAARLQTLTDRFVESRFSLRTLLTEVATDPLFNAGMPEACGTDAYALPPVVNPWSVEDDDPARRPNSPGDLAHRHLARVLQRSVHHHLGWEAPPAWGLTESELELQAAIGVWLRESQPGFNGTDYQGLLAFTTRYGTCTRPGGGPDWISALGERSADSTAEQVVMALRDRLLADGRISDAERPLVEALVGPLDAPATQLTSAGVRALCGAWIAGPTYLLALDAEQGPLPPDGSLVAEECDRASRLVARSGRDAAACP